jgi:hypothetical protein
MWCQLLLQMLQSTHSCSLGVLLWAISPALPLSSRCALFAGRIFHLAPVQRTVAIDSCSADTNVSRGSMYNSFFSLCNNRPSEHCAWMFPSFFLHSSPTQQIVACRRVLLYFFRRSPTAYNLQEWGVKMQQENPPLTGPAPKASEGEERSV